MLMFCILWDVLFTLYALPLWAKYYNIYSNIFKSNMQYGFHTSSVCVYVCVCVCVCVCVRVACTCIQGTQEHHTK